MARGKLSPETLKKRQLEKFQALLGEADSILGLQTATPTIEDLREIQDAKIDGPLDLALEAEATLLYYETKGKGFTRSTCPQCGKTFAFLYSIPTIKPKCSNECRSKALAAIGIRWDYLKKPHERWNNLQRGAIPLIVPAHAFDILEDKLREES